MGKIPPEKKKSVRQTGKTVAAPNFKPYLTQRRYADIGHVGALWHPLRARTRPVLRMPIDLARINHGRVTRRGAQGGRVVSPDLDGRQGRGRGRGRRGRDCGAASHGAAVGGGGQRGGRGAAAVQRGAEAGGRAVWKTKKGVESVPRFGGNVKCAKKSSW